MEALFGSGDRCLDTFGLPPLLAGRPIEAAQAIEDRTTDFVFGIRLELVDVVARVEIVDGGN